MKPLEQPNPQTAKSRLPLHLRPNYKWLVVGMLWWMCFFNYADRQAVTAVFPLLERDMHLNKVQMGMIGAAFALVYGLFAPFAGSVGDLFARKKVILWGLWLWSAICYATGLARNYTQLLVFRAAEGLGETFYFPATTSFLSDYHDKRTRSRALGLHNTGVYTGVIGGSVFAGLISTHYGWGSSFKIFGVLGILLGLVLMRFIVEPKRGAADRAEAGLAEKGSATTSEAPRPSPLPGGEGARRLPRVALAMVAYAACVCGGAAAGYLVGRLVGFDLAAGNVPVSAFIGALPGIAVGLPLALYINQGQAGLDFLRWVVRTPTVLVLMLCFMCANFVALVAMSWMPKFLYDKFSWDLAQAALMATIFINLSNMLGAPLGGLFADLLRRRTAGGRMIVQACAMLLAAPFVYLTGFTHAVALLVVGLAGWGLLKGMYDANIFASAFDFIPPQMRGSAAGVMNMAGWLGAFPAPILVGYLAEQTSLSLAIASASSVYVLGALLMMVGVLAFARRDAARMGLALAKQE